MRQYVLVPGADRARLERLAELLVGQGIEVRVAAAELQAGARTFPAGSIVVPLAQPAGRLVRNLLDPRVSMDEAFVKEQERRRKKRLPRRDLRRDGLEPAPRLRRGVRRRRAPLDGRDAPLRAGGGGRGPALAAAKVAWLLPWGSGTAAAVAEALQAGLKVRVAEAGLRLGGRALPAGTAIVRVAENPESARETLGADRAPARRRRRGRRHRATSRTASRSAAGACASSRSRGCSSPGTGRPRASPPGWARWVLERRYGQPVTAVRVSSLGRVDLARYDVLVLPSGDYGDALGTGGVKRLRDWVDRGGHPRRPRRGLALAHPREGGPPRHEDGAARRHARRRSPRSDEKKEAEKPPAKDKDDKPEAFDLEKAIQPERERPDAVPGALLRVTLDPEHWLAAGTDGEIHAIVESRRVFTPLKLDKGTNVGVYAKKDQVVGSGLVWDDVAGPPRPEGLPDARARRRGPRRRLRRGPELPRLRRGHGAAVHERGAARPGLSSQAGVQVLPEATPSGRVVRARRARAH